MNAQEIETGLDQIRKALGNYLCTADQPCAAQAYYDEGEDAPWRIADDYTHESFITLNDAISAAEAWADMDLLRQ